MRQNNYICNQLGRADDLDTDCSDTLGTDTAISTFSTRAKRKVKPNA